MPPPERTWPKEFCIITACNPHGRLLEDAENQRRNDQLRIELEKEKLAFTDLIGASPDRAHQEPSFAVAIGAEAGLKLARAFDQLAIYHVHGDRLELIYSASEERTPLGSFRVRVHLLHGKG